MLIQTICIQCNNIFLRHHNRPGTKFCSENCKNIAQKIKVEEKKKQKERYKENTGIFLKCIVCNKEFEKPFGSGRYKFCSHNCYQENKIKKDKENKILKDKEKIEKRENI